MRALTDRFEIIDSRTGKRAGFPMRDCTSAWLEADEREGTDRANWFTLRVRRVAQSHLRVVR